MGAGGGLIRGHEGSKKGVATDAGKQERREAGGRIQGHKCNETAETAN